MSCNYCHGLGHFIANCYKKQRDEANGNQNANRNEGQQQNQGQNE